jgi:hypothetical protein
MKSVLWPELCCTDCFPVQFYLLSCAAAVLSPLPSLARKGKVGEQENVEQRRIWYQRWIEIHPSGNLIHLAFSISAELKTLDRKIRTLLPTAMFYFSLLCWRIVVCALSAPVEFSPRPAGEWLSRYLTLVDFYDWSDGTFNKLQWLETLSFSGAILHGSRWQSPILITETYIMHS